MRACVHVRAHARAYVVCVRACARARAVQAAAKLGHHAGVCLIYDLEGLGFHHMHKEGIDRPASPGTGAPDRCASACVHALRARVGRQPQQHTV